MSTSTLRAPAASPPAAERRYADVRAATLALADPLTEADCQVQSMADASPVKWHLAHTTWFFETFLLEPHERGFKPFHPAFRVLFNSYYNGIGEQHPRPQRGLVTRPGLDEVIAYRAQVDARMAALLAAPQPQALHDLVTLGLHHEQQHQELILTDVKHLLSCNPLAPRYAEAARPSTLAHAIPAGWQHFDGGLVDIGHTGDGFAFDNESPRHRHYLRPYALARKPVTQGDWAEFIADDAYQEPRWWLAAGWDSVRTQQIAAPMYWQDGSQFTLHGKETIDAHAPVVHISFYEADAYARWWSAQHPGQTPARLPTEFEWEHAASSHEADARSHANFVESRALQPRAARAVHAGPLQLFGDVWEWTSSSYSPYPGFAAWDGAVGEYNAKFMVDQYVLRGGSCATPASHLRASYRNFFPAATRWQFSGLRLARDER
jgi:ergothioneine biosynthesis protein EgtB